MNNWVPGNTLQTSSSILGLNGPFVSRGSRFVTVDFQEQPSSSAVPVKPAENIEMAQWFEQNKGALKETSFTAVQAVYPIDPEIIVETPEPSSSVSISASLSASLSPSNSVSNSASNSASPSTSSSSSPSNSPSSSPSISVPPSSSASNSSSISISTSVSISISTSISTSISNSPSP